MKKYLNSLRKNGSLQILYKAKINDGPSPWRHNLSPTLIGHAIVMGTSPDNVKALEIMLWTRHFEFLYYILSINKEKNH
jgi:hypothetical protein